MPRLGGLAIFAGAAAGYFTGGLYHRNLTAISLGAIIIVLVGILDDKYELSLKVKFMAQLLVAVLIVSSGLTINLLSHKLIEEKQFEWLR